MKLIYTDDLIVFLRSPTAKFPLAIAFSILDLNLRHPQKRETRMRHSKVVSLCELPSCCFPAHSLSVVLARLWWLRGAESWPDAHRQW